MQSQAILCCYMVILLVTFNRLPNMTKVVSHFFIFFLYKPETSIILHYILNRKNCLQLHEKCSFNKNSLIIQYEPGIKIVIRNTKMNNKLSFFKNSHSLMSQQNYKKLCVTQFRSIVSEICPGHY